MRILGAAPRIPNPKEVIPTSLRLADRQSTSFDRDDPAACFNVWRTRNADDDDERIALADWDPASLPNARWPSTSPSAEPWLTALLVVTFDHDRGQMLEACAPRNALTQAELDTVCGHAMPDSASASKGCEDALFSFRIPRRLHPSEEKAGCISVASTRLLFAHVLYRQAPAPQTKRGYIQKSLIIVTSTPYLGVPALLLSVLAPKAFVHGQSLLNHAYNDVAEWPDPRRESLDGNTYLPFVDDLVSVEWSKAFLTSFSAPAAKLYTNAKSFDSLPSSNLLMREQNLWEVSNALHSEATVPPTKRIWASCNPLTNKNAPIFHEVNPVVALSSVIDLIPAIWEIVVTGEPLLVYAPTPTASSAAVMAIISLIHPLPFVGDWRPYFCIQDPDYERILKAKNIHDLFPEGAIFGITSRHLVDTMKFPHVLYLSPTRNDSKSTKGRLISSFRSCLPRSRTFRQSATRALYAHSSLNSQMANEAISEFRTCLQDKITRPFLRVFDKYLLPTWGGGRPISDERYVLDPFDKKLQLLPLSMDSFPTSDDLSSPKVNILFKKGSLWKPRLRLLYHKFVQGPVFREWWHGARTIAENKCLDVHRKHILEACARGCTIIRHTLLAKSASKAQMVQSIVDVARRVRQELCRVSPEDTVLQDSLQKELKYLKDSLPRNFAGISQAWAIDYAKEANDMKLISIHQRAGG